MTQPNASAYGAAHFALEVDNENLPIGLVRSVDGGTVKRDVQTYHSSGGNEATVLPTKVLGKQSYEDMKLEVGMAMGKAFYQWLIDSIRGENVRRSGAIVAYDMRYKERARRVFEQAIIKEVAFPSLDGKNTNPVLLNVTLTPEIMRFDGPTEGGTYQPDEHGYTEQRRFTGANFLLELDDDALVTRRVLSVDGFSIKREVMEYHLGNQTMPQRVPGRVEYPEKISFSIPTADTGPFLSRMKSDHSEPKKFSGCLSLLDASPSPSGTTPETLIEIRLFGCQVSSVTQEKHDASSTEIAKSKIELSVEKVELNYLETQGETGGAGATSGNTSQGLGGSLGG